MYSRNTDLDPLRIGERSDAVLTWLFFGSGIGVSLATALMYGLLPLQFAPGMRTLLIGGCLVLALVFLLTGWLMRDVRLDRAALIAGWAAVVLITLVSVGLGQGVHAVALGFFGVVIGAAAAGHGGPRRIQ